MQKILTGSNVSHIDEHALGDMAGGVDSVSYLSRFFGSQIQNQLRTANSSSSLPQTWPDSCMALGAPAQVAESDSSRPELSVLSNAACATPPIGSSQSGTVTPASFAFQTTATEGSDSNQQPSVTSPVAHHTWITATSQEALSSGVTIIPFLTLRKISSTATAVESSLGATLTSTSSDPSFTTINNQHSSIISSSATTASFTAVSHLPQVDGVSSMDKAGDRKSVV